MAVMMAAPEQQRQLAASSVASFGCIIIVCATNGKPIIPLVKGATKTIVINTLPW
jgi:hypothetical protein